MQLRSELFRAGPRTLDPTCLTLDNGLRFLLIENHFIPSVSFNMTFLAGSRYETEGLAGLAAMVSRLLEEGTTNRSSLDIAQAIESVGGAIGCEGAYERVSVFLSVLSKDLELGLELVADIVMNPLFAKESLDRQRERVLAEIESAKDRPQVIAGWKFDELVYGTHPLHRPACGYSDTVSNISVADLNEYHHRFFIPNNAIVSIVGDFVTDEIAEKLQGLFSGWSGGELKSPELQPAARQSEVRRETIRMPTQQAHVCFGHLGIDRSNSDFYALQVLDTIFGGGAGLTARIPHKLRDEQGLAYTTFANITKSAGMDPGRFLAYIATAAINVDRAIMGFVEEVERIRREPVTQQELEDAKAFLTGSFVFDFETSAQIGRFLVNAEIYELGFDYPEKYPAYIDAVSIEDITRVAMKYLSTTDYTLVVVGPEH